MEVSFQFPIAPFTNMLVKSLEKVLQDKLPDVKSNEKEKEYTVKEAAEVLKRSTSSIGRYMKSGRLGFDKRGVKGIVIKQHHIDDFDKPGNIRGVRF